jgi:hypothetical protein
MYVTLRQIKVFGPVSATVTFRTGSDVSSEGEETYHFRSVRDCIAEEPLFFELGMRDHRWYGPLVDTLEKEFGTLDLGFIIDAVCKDIEATRNGRLYELARRTDYSSFLNGAVDRVVP